MKKPNIEIAGLEGTLSFLRASAKRTGGADLLATAALAWIEWLEKPEFRPISKLLIDSVRRSAVPEVAKEDEKLELRGWYEWALTACAVLSGDVPTMHLAAGVVKGARVGSKQDPAYGSVAGIIKARLLGNAKDEQKQLEVFTQCRGDGSHPLPSRELLTAFVNRDYVKLDQAVTAGAKKHWTDSYLGRGTPKPVILEDSPRRLVIDVWQKDANYKWPYPEAVFAKLAIMEGAIITHDDFWFPLALVRAMADSAEKEPASIRSNAQPKIGKARKKATPARRSKPRRSK